MNVIALRWRVFQLLRHIVAMNVRKKVADRDFWESFFFILARTKFFLRIFSGCYHRQEHEEQIKVSEKFGWWCLSNSTAKHSKTINKEGKHKFLICSTSCRFMRTTYFGWKYLLSLRTSIRLLLSPPAWLSLCQKKETTKCAVEHVVTFEVVFVHLLRIESALDIVALIFFLANENRCRCESSNRMNLTCSFNCWREHKSLCNRKFYAHKLTMLYDHT